MCNMTKNNIVFLYSMSMYIFLIQKIKIDVLKYNNYN